MITQSDAPFTFGRSPDCSLQLTVSDRSIPRVAGRISWSGQTWELKNVSTSRPLYIVDNVGLKRTLPVGDVAAIRPGRTRVLVVGAQTHEISVAIDEVADTEHSIAVPTASDASEETTMPPITRNERIALVALAEGYLLPYPRYDPAPRTYGAAAERLGVPEATVRKRVENVRNKLIASGVFQIEASDARAGLVEFVLATQLVRSADLALLDEPDVADEPSSTPT